MLTDHCSRSLCVAFAVVSVIVGRVLHAEDEPAKKGVGRVGMIGLDTSHSVAFTKIFNDPKATGDLALFRVVAAYPKGTPDIPSGTSRVAKYTEQMRGMGIEIVDSISALLERVDYVLLETIDGRPHLEQVLPVLRAGKTVYIDKPFAGSLTDTLAIFALAKQYGVPMFTSSSLRFAPSTMAVRGGKVGRVLSADVGSPAHIEPRHPDLYWYGIHGVESLFTVMGAGCESVVRTVEDGALVVHGTWKDGRKGTFRERKGYGGKVVGEKGEAEAGRYEGYAPLVVEIAKFFRTGVKPIPDRESIEIYAFMEAADESKRRGGASVALREVIDAARIPLAKGRLVVDGDFPGGNIRVAKLDADEILVQQELRDTDGWSFWWNFRARGHRAGQKVRFRFDGRSPIGVRGPAVSIDGGVTWSWLGKDSVDDASFVYTFPREEAVGAVQFAFAVPYTWIDLHRFLSRIGKSPHLRVDTLATTRRARAIERLHFGRVDGKARRKVLLTARHHARESTANFALEGIVEFVLGDTDEARRLREEVEFVAIPFVDKDGVEDGDQGKRRKPHDHNRDYLGEPIWPSVRALRTFVPEWSAGRLRLAIDLHCPAISGVPNERIFLVEGSGERGHAALDAFAAILEESVTGPLPYSKRYTMRWDKGWNKAAEGLLATCANWSAGLLGVELATTLELPFANAGGVPVTPESARAFGRDLGRAIATWLAQGR